jgi:aspartate kinase
VVDGRFASGLHPVKAVSAIQEHGLISVEGKGMAGVPGIAARVFGVLANKRISVTMISQSSSESTICLAVPSTRTLDAEAALKGEFQLDMARGVVEEIVAHRKVGLVAVVGLGMAQTPGVAGRVFSALGRAGINVLAIAQGTAELNISLAVNGDRVDDAVRTLHKEFELHLPDTGTADSSGGEP